MLGTSIAAVVLGCFCFCPLDCDASVMVVDCAAVKTGCVLKYTRPNHSPVSLQRPICWGPPTVPQSRSFFFTQKSGFRPSWSRCCCCCCLLLLLPTTSVLKRREMLGTSVAAVVLGCFYFCPLDCDASVMVVDCAAVETGCILEK